MSSIFSALFFPTAPAVLLGLVLRDFLALLGLFGVLSSADLGVVAGRGSILVARRAHMGWKVAQHPLAAHLTKPGGRSSIPPPAAEHVPVPHKTHTVTLLERR